MSRYEYLASESSLRATLDRQNADALQKLLALLPGVKLKAPRKGDLSERWSAFFWVVESLNFGNGWVGSCSLEFMGGSRASRRGNLMDAAAAWG